jgi:hypothetical protein
VLDSDTDSLTVTYSIPKSRTKDITLEGEEDYAEMVGQVQAKKSAEGTLILVENKVRRSGSLYVCW